MIYTKHGVRCERCFREEHEAQHVFPGEKTAALLRALSSGPKTLSELAKAVHGIDTPQSRRKISSLMQRALGDAVENIGKGTWQLALAQQQPEAAE